MAKDPAVLFYTSDFLTGTYTMTDEQVGKYIRLLCLQHQKGKLTEQDMLSVCKAYDERVFNKFINENGVFFNERLLEETNKRNLYCESRRKSAYAKRTHNIRLTYVERMENENINENVVINEIKKEIKNKIKFEFNEVWNQYPDKVGRKEAEKHFKATVLTEEDFNNIKIALENYKNCKRVRSGYIQNGSTWFNNWKDWVSYQEYINPENEELEMRKKLGLPTGVKK